MGLQSFGEWLGGGRLGGGVHLSCPPLPSASTVHPHQLPLSTATAVRPYRPSAVGLLGRSSGRGDVWTRSDGRPLDVIFLEDVESDNPSHNKGIFGHHKDIM